MTSLFNLSGHVHVAQRTRASSHMRLLTNAVVCLEAVNKAVQHLNTAVVAVKKKLNENVTQQLMLQCH